MGTTGKRDLQVACQQCGGLGEVDVSHGRKTRRVPCRCLRDRVAALERELDELRRKLREAVERRLHVRFRRRTT